MCINVSAKISVAEDAELSSSKAQAINSGIYWRSWALLNYSITFFNLSKDNRSITAIKIKDIISFEDNRTSGRPNQKNGEANTQWSQIISEVSLQLFMKQ